jgi:hypothetical protein
MRSSIAIRKILGRCCSDLKKSFAVSAALHAKASTDPEVGMRPCGHGQLIVAKIVAAACLAHILKNRISTQRHVFRYFVLLRIEGALR